jgi:CheY-like chemotaxis protein
VLVAEDNVTNQKLVEALLTQRGHVVTTVPNGRLAIERATKEPFDVILMDVQMPEVSGLEATTAIREHERGTGRRIPILALTASAMAGDREECLAAGMDAYVSKPLRPDELFATIDALCGCGPASTSAAAPSASRSVNLDTLLAGFDGNGRLVQEVVDVFMEDAPAMISRLRDAAGARDTVKLASAAHALKGAAGLFAEGRAYESARRLERLAKAGDLSAAGPALADVEADVAQLIAELRDLRDKLPLKT